MKPYLILVYGCPNLIMLFINRKKLPWNPCTHIMKQNYIIFSNQLVHGWHEVIQNVSVVPNMHGMGQTGGGGQFLKTN